MAATTAAAAAVVACVLLVLAPAAMLQVEAANEFPFASFDACNEAHWDGMFSFGQYCFTDETGRARFSLDVALFEDWTPSFDCGNFFMEDGTVYGSLTRTVSVPPQDTSKIECDR